MAKYSLKAQIRDVTGKKVAQVREQNMIPSVLYGAKIENQNISVKKNDFLKIYNQAGSSSLIDLQVDDKQPVPILIQDLQTDPKSGDITHVDFYQIQEGVKITAIKELEFTGESPAVKELAGILVKNYDEVEVECLPKDLDLIDTIEVDISVLKTFADAIHIKDLQVPEQIKISEALDDVVVQVMEPKEEKIEEPVVAEGEEAAEGEEGEAAEGEAAEGEAKEGEAAEGDTKPEGEQKPE